MTLRMLIPALAVVLSLGAGACSAEEEDGVIDPAREAQVRASLTEQGYEVRSGRP